MSKGTENETILNIKDLHTEFRTESGWVSAVDGVSFSLKKGKTLGIVGESGCGKSVTSMSIIRLLDQKKSRIRGEVYLGGKEILGLDPVGLQKVRGNEITMIFQEPMTALNPVMTIGFQLEEVLRQHKGIKGRTAREEILSMLNKVGIPRAESVIKEYPHQLSGGQRQRIMIAMALLCHPKVLIADEPTTALDVTIEAQVLELMKELQDEFEMGILFITHDLSVIAEMADDVLVMYAGHVVEQCTVRELFDRPLHPYTKGLLASRPSLARKGEKLALIPGVVPGLSDRKPGCPFFERCPHAKEACQNALPELSEKYPGHLVRCLFTGETGGGNQDE